jgi:hypothetical protein
MQAANALKEWSVMRECDWSQIEDGLDELRYRPK